MANLKLFYKNMLVQFEEQQKEESSLIAGSITNTDRTNIGKDIGQVSIEPLTVVNLLGKDGNFEVDSNSDGLADGWTAINPANSTYTLSNDSVFGSYSQRVVNSGGTGGNTKKISGVSGHKYFLFAYLKGTEYRLKAGTTDASSIYVNISGTNTIFEKKYKSFTATINDFWVNNFSIDGADFLNDGMALIDLTNAGKIPKSLQQIYGDINFDDPSLTDDALSEIFDYVDSVSSFGYNWNDGEVTEVIENRGVNLLNGNKELFKNSGISSTTLYVNNTSLLSERLSYIIPVKKNTDYTLYFPESEFLNRRWVAVAENIYDGCPVTLISTDADIYETFNTRDNNYIVIYLYNGVSAEPKNLMDYIYENISDYDLMLYEGTEELAYIPPRQDKIEISQSMFAQFGVSDKNIGNQLIKSWEAETIVKSTTFAPTSKNGTGDCILIDNSDGAIYFSTISGTNITEGTIPDGTFLVLYQLTTPEIQNLTDYTNTFKQLGSTDNQIIATSQQVLESVGDGYTTSFTHNLGSTDYQVFVSGIEVIEGITKQLTNVVFDTAPRYNQIIEVIYNVENSKIYATIELLENQGVLTNIHPVNNLTIQEISEGINNDYADYSNDIERFDTKYRLSMSKDILENLGLKFEEWKNKIIRMKLTTADGLIYYYCNGKMTLDNSNKDWYNSNENINILFTDFYDTN